MAEKRYRVTNTTVKQPKIDPKSNRDLRTAIERVGHPVSWRDSKGNSYAVAANQNPRYVTEIPEGLYRLQRGGLVRIEEVGDITDDMKAHVVGRTASTPEVKATIEDTREIPSEEPRKAGAVEMGKDDHSDNLVNPDGPDNFTVTAPRGGTEGKKRKNRKNHRGAKASEQSATTETVDVSDAPVVEGEASGEVTAE